MTEKDIKPIPNYIMDEIYKRDLKIHPWQESMVRYYAYLTIWKKELVKVTVAVTTQKKQWCCKQVAVHGINSPKCFVKDMEYNYFGYGYRVGWFTEELQPYQKRFEDGKWYTADTNTTIPTPRSSTEASLQRSPNTDIAHISIIRAGISFRTCGSIHGFRRPSICSKTDYAPMRRT